MIRVHGTILAACSAAALIAAMPAAAQMRLIHSEPGPNRGVRAESTQWFADQAAARTNGDIQIDIHWGGALFNAAGALSGISNGAADSGLIIGAYLQSEFPELYMGDLPLGDGDPWVSMQAMNELFTTNAGVAASLKDKNLAYMGIYATSPLQIGCRGDALTSVADVPGMKMRYGGVYGEVFSNLGGNMVEMSIYDAFQGVETGLIDCTPTYAYFAVATKLDELLDSLTPVDLSPATSIGTFMNLDAYDALTPAQQAALADIRVELLDRYAERMMIADEKALASMTTRDKPIAIHTLSADDYVKINEAAAPVIVKWKKAAAAKGFDADALLVEYKGLLAKWTKVRDDRGYPWTRG